MNERASAEGWYKVTIDHGPGHQSQTIRFEHSDPERIEREIDEEFSDAIVKLERLERLPEAIAIHWRAPRCRQNKSRVASRAR